MIGRLSGTLLESSPERVLLDVSGVGYEIQIPLSTFYELPEAGRSVQLFIHTHVRAEALQLYGFAHAEERRVFERLIAISGVGPRMALAFLSGIGADELVSAVHAEDRARLQRIPGVGKKTAERVLLELRDRIGFDPPESKPRAAAGKAAAANGGAREEALSALLNLGYARDTAARAITATMAETDDSATLETVLRSALRRLVGAS
ncbi:MAG: Holliday junction branch migration protein RuvA [Acidobacteria bacterium]|nr:Holliday junction branch migration protein RuvA [Acidobacteriota bacterium]NIM60106.1 Holliday junction branch migration protein RuvA [Acidobacteriota bacterium]NIO59464.1 Holliday junction branch migration protein RuvA [Acidobacteriota bacterium]NIQ30495.1 Holliday junction branch migration protein RuvA [Acidobacteriota bacterium]NIQ85434.1 Holliday junction branch migration protein RuvA [Acidobacteriota bacterium]